LKVVLDTSVLIAAFYSPPHRPSFSRNVFDYLAEEASIHLCPFIFQEFRRKCIQKLDLTVAETENLMSLLRGIVHEEPEPLLQEIKGLRDPNDASVASLAMAIGADLLITWDKDLLVLEKIGVTQIKTPRQFWDFL
jgi:putative PIN family toxin of toxin-antitoxin system